MRPIKLIELSIDDLAFGARGVAREGNFVWFVEGAIPGQKVIARIRRKKKSHGEAVVHEVLQSSPFEIPPPCPYFSDCGGCKLQHLDYTKQVEYKLNQLGEVLERIGGINRDILLDPVRSDTVYHYRNKMEYTFSNRRWLLKDDSMEKPADFALGLHAPGRFDKVLDIDNCLLPSETANRILSVVRDAAFSSGLPPYDLKTHTGFWRFLIIREGRMTGQHMVNIITTGETGQAGLKAVDAVADRLNRELQPATVVHSISDRLSQVAYGDAMRVISGPGMIIDRIGNSQFEISPEAFFQTNTIQAHKLFQTIVDLADFSGSETVYDLYCGTGAIGIFIAPFVRHVLGIEVIEPAIRDAQQNAALNSLENIEFILADMKDALRESAILNRKERPDLIILDPPRGGTHPRTIEDLIRLNSPRIIYVSCNPAILARDLKTFAENGYKTEAVRMVDMFPQTAHIETVALLRKSKQKENL